MTTRPTLTVASAVVAAGLVVGVGLAMMPSPPTMSAQTSGDTALGSRVEQGLRDAGVLDKASIAVVDADGVTYAGFGADLDTEYEIGSVTKTMTGQLLQDAIDRGELTASTTLGAILPLGDSPAASITLEDAVTHRSGLPPLGSDPSILVNVVLKALTHSNPYEYTVDEMIENARTSELTDPGEYAYSNLGMSLVGQAVATRAGLTFPELVTQRLLEPLGMDASSVPLTVAELDDPTTGYTATGVAEDPWAIGGYAPAGGVRSTIEDMARYAAALLDGTAPGSGAMEPRVEIPLGHSGFAWIVLDSEDGDTWTLHNGQTGGFASYLILDRDAHRAVVVLNSSSASTEDVALSLLTEADPS